MLYLKHFKTDSSRIDYEQSSTNKHVSYSIESDAAYIKTQKQYLTFSILSDGIIYFSGTSSGSITNEIQYSLDGGNTWSEPAQILTLNVNSGDEVKWKGRMTPAIEGLSRDSGIGTFSGSTAQFNLKYDIMSLLYSDDFDEHDELVRTSTFAHLFLETKVVNANQLILKSNNLTDYCYMRMFKECGELIEMPYLLSKNLAEYCYFEMFYHCTKLTKTTALTASEMKISCYHRMFGNCSNLVKITTLPSKKMADHCYEAMFSNCSSLVTPPILDATELAHGCYDSMFQNCTSLTTVPQLPATIIPISAYTYMFAGCTLITESPKLNAIDLQYRCYRYMFSGCTNINYIHALFKTIPDDISDVRQYTHGWVLDVPSSGLFVQNINATWGVSGTNYSVGSGLPSGWTVIYYDESLDKYFTDKQRTQECDDHGNPI